MWQVARHVGNVIVSLPEAITIITSDCRVMCTSRTPVFTRLKTIKNCIHTWLAARSHRFLSYPSFSPTPQYSPQYAKSKILQTWKYYFQQICKGVWTNHTHRTIAKHSQPRCEVEAWKKPNHSILDLPANDHKEFKSHWKFESNMMILCSLLPPQLDHTIHQSIGDRKLCQICDNLTCHVSMQIPKTASHHNLNFDTRKPWYVRISWFWQTYVWFTSYCDMYCDLKLI